VRSLVLLTGPLVYLCAVHLVFVSSIRYRIPGEMVAASLAGFGFQSIVSWIRANMAAARRGSPTPPSQ
jgi:hypothetical protein